jgi:phosphate transport system protein
MDVLRKNLYDMRKLTEQALRYSLALLCDNRSEPFQVVRAVEKRINELETQNDDAVMKYCTLPLCSNDLRFLLKSVKISGELERIGNHAFWLSEFAHTRKLEISSVHSSVIVGVYEKIIHLSKSVLQIFLSEGSVRVAPPGSRDFTKECERIAHSLLRMTSESSRNGNLPSDLFLVSRALDRITDLLQAIVHEVELDHESLPVSC